MVKKGVADKKAAEKKPTDKKSAKGGGEGVEKPAAKVGHVDSFAERCMVQVDIRVRAGSKRQPPSM
jgi:hypothetical protein